MNLTSLLLIVIVIYVIAAITLLVLLRPFRIILILVIGLPIQMLFLGYLTKQGLLPIAELSNFWKELLIVVALLTATALQRVRLAWSRTDQVVAIYAFIVTLYLFAPHIVSTDEEIRVRLFGYGQAIMPALIYMLGRTLVLSRPEREQMMRLLVVTGAVVALVAIVDRILTVDSFWEQIGVVQYVGHVSSDPNPSSNLYFYSYALGGGTRRAIAPYGSPLVLAFSLILPLAIVIAAIAKRSPLIRRPWLHLCGIVIGAAILLSLTRGVIVGMVAASVVALIIVGNWRQSVKLTLGFMLVAMVLGSQLHTAASAVLSLSDPSAQVHAQSLEQGLEVIREHPLGVGLGEGGFVGRVLGTSAAGGESLFLVMAAQQGVVTLLLFGVLIVSVIRRTARRAVAASASGDGDLALAVLIATIAFALGSVTTEHWFAFESATLFWLVAGDICRSYPREQAPRAMPLGRKHGLMVGHA